MERLTLDQEGARTGEISESSMQFGNDTVTIRNIATMTVEDTRFRPYDTPRNHSTVKMYYGFAAIAGLLLVCGVVWWMIVASMGSAEVFAPAVITALGVVICASLLWRASRLGAMVKRTTPYYKLLIGTSDGRQLTLVDDNKQILLQIRDVLRHKVDTDDRHQRAKFDLNVDQVEIVAGDAV